MPAFMSKVHATDIYWTFLELPGIFWHFQKTQFLTDTNLVKLSRIYRNKLLKITSIIFDALLPSYTLLKD